MTLRIVPDPILRLGGGGLSVVSAAADAQTYTQKVLALSPLALWPLESDLNDASGNGYNGAAVGTVPFTGTGPDGNACVVLDGSTNAVNVYGVALASAWNGAELTVMAWAKLAATDSSTRRFLRFGVDANNNITIYKDPSNVEQYVYAAGGTIEQISGAPRTAGVWHHFAMTISKTNDRARAYRDGAQTGSDSTALGTWSGSLAATGNIIGALSTTPTQAFNGQVKFAAVWARELSAAEILQAATI